MGKLYKKYGQGNSFDFNACKVQEKKKIGMKREKKRRK